MYNLEKTFCNLFREQYFFIKMNLNNVFYKANKRPFFEKSFTKPRFCFVEHYASPKFKINVQKSF